MADRLIEVDLEPWEIDALLSTGLAVRAVDDVVAFTDAGNAWLQAWCDGEFASHVEASAEPG